jgi:hypothetical protein
VLEGRCRSGFLLCTVVGTSGYKGFGLSMSHSINKKTYKQTPIGSNSESGYATHTTEVVKYSCWAVRRQKTDVKQRGSTRQTPGEGKWQRVGAVATRITRIRDSR